MSDCKESGLAFPPRMMNAAWHIPRPERYHDYRGLMSPEFAQQFARVSYPTYTLSLIAAHSGDPTVSWLFFLYGSFADMDVEGRWWDEAPAEFVHRHRAFNKQMGVTVQNQIWKYIVLREDLSHRPHIDASEFAQIRYVQMDEVTVRPGRLQQFEDHRRALAEASARARIEQAIWVYEVQSGGPTDSFQVWTVYRSLGEGSYGHISQFDSLPDRRQRIEQALGDESSAVAEAAAESIHDSTTTLLTVNPGSSYAPPEFKAADPSFWNSTTPAWP